MKKAMKKTSKMYGGTAKKKMKKGGKAISKSKQKGLAALAKKNPIVEAGMGYDPKKITAAMGGLKKAIAKLEKAAYGGLKKKK